MTGVGRVLFEHSPATKSPVVGPQFLSLVEREYENDLPRSKPSRPATVLPVILRSLCFLLFNPLVAAAGRAGLSVVNNPCRRQADALDISRSAF